MEEIIKLCNEIKQQLIGLQMNGFVLYADDYWGDLKDEDIDISDFISDSAYSLDWFFNMQESVDGFSVNYLFARKISIKDDDVVFELEEIYEDEKDNHKSLRTYKDLTIEKIMETCPEKYVQRCLTGILESAFKCKYYKVIDLNRIRLQK